ncbi:SGNH/GDSL hydrolase family protein [Calothrix rhizosoleniae]|uniref:SGNH/GDSL hydrolase family protein n=1 Tax=Calothrix rhizosoleniae TaxID=888997 RepID=UPI000B4A005A|nr:SGNH/GDSL hydrolase family protein [Calothrix rhizosoleniae]
MRLVLLASIGILFTIFVVLEIGLRWFFGFGNPLIYITDPHIGYLLAPNQQTRRFGNRIQINQYSMRTAPIAKKPSSSSLRVLLLGDSIANGGWWTDQTNTISSLMSSSLSANYQDKFLGVEVLNASANSWGPRNELAYLQHFGNFHSQVVVLLINTDDLFATAPTSLPVGRDRNYPAKTPPLALLEVFQRYVIKQKPIPELQAVHQEGGDRVGVNLDAIGKIHALTNQQNCQLILVMTPLLREIGKPGPRDYEIKARQRLTEFTQSRHIAYIDFLPIFNSYPDPKALYHDTIHLNLSGNQLVTNTITQKLVKCPISVY